MPKNTKKAPRSNWRAERAALLYRQGFLPVSDAAKLAGVHFVTIYKALSRGDLRGTAYGKNRYVSIDSLAAWVPEGTLRNIVRLAKTNLPAALREAEALKDKMSSLLTGQSE